MDREEIVAELAGRLRAAFASRQALHVRTLSGGGVLDPDEACHRMHPMWDGGENSRGQRYDAVWPGLASLAYDRRIDVRDWVDCLFGLAYRFDRVPTPQDLRSDPVLAALENFREKRADDILFVVRTELLTASQEVWFRGLTTALTPAAVERQVLLDPMVDLSPLTRYVFAVDRGHADLASLAEASAFAQYRVAPEAYDRAYGGGVPGRLRELIDTVK